MLHAVAITRLLTGASVGETEAGAGPRAPSGRYRIRTRPRGASTQVGLALGAFAALWRVHGAWRDPWKTGGGPPSFASAAAVDQAPPTGGSSSLRRLRRLVAVARELGNGDARRPRRKRRECVPSTSGAQCEARRLHMC